MKHHRIPCRLAALSVALSAALLAVLAPSAAMADFSSAPVGSPSLGAQAFGANPFAAAASPPNRSAARQQPHPAVARIVVPEHDGTSYGSGTLVDVTDTQGLVITNWHVVENQSGPITVVFPDGFRSQATVLKHDPTWDLAALSIWKPNVEPVPLAAARPKPGDILAIAGYGGGDYRMAVGRCTQFVAPSPRHPFEMVELSAAARQGDSGGPILNQRGEMAGVLFGEGDGKTAGSDVGRVAQFLAPIRGTQDARLARLTSNRSTHSASTDGWRPADDAPPLAPSSLAPSPFTPPSFARGPSATANDRGAPNDPMAARIAPSNLAPAPPTATHVPANPTAGGWSWSPGVAGSNAAAPGDNSAAPPPTLPFANARPSYPPPASTATTASPSATDPSAENDAGENIANILGATRFEQAKSILAIIGAIAIVVTFSKAFAKA